MPSALIQHARRMRSVYKRHVKTLVDGANWRGPCQATVDLPDIDDVREAMNFMGSLVDTETTLPSGRVRLTSRGYWAHGF